MSSTSFDKMEKDKRYTPANEVPEEVLSTMGSDEIFSPGFSIKGQALAGRASYLVSIRFYGDKSARARSCSILFFMSRS